MPVTENKSTEEQKQAEQQELVKRETEIAKDIVKSLDLSAGLDDQMKKHLLGEQLQEEVNEEVSEEAEAEEVSEETQEEPTTTEEGEDSELEPKAKDSVQKRINELTREKKLLEQRLAKLESQSQSNSNTDPDLAKLEQMSESELKALKTKVALAIRRETDDTKAEQLLELEDKIKSVIETTPQRFQKQQVERFYEAVETTPDQLDDATKQTIFGYAKGIFERSASLQKSVNGQAEAWNLALEHYRELSKLSAGKSKAVELERKLNTVKKKISLDTAIQKGNSKVSDEAKLYKRAANGTFEDKADFIKKKMNTDSLIPDEFRR